MPLSTMSKKKSSAQPRTRVVLKKIIEAALRQKFPRDTINISDGYEDNIHVLVVSKIFDKMNEREKISYLSKIIEATALTRAEKDLVVALMAYSPRELM